MLDQLLDSASLARIAYSLVLALIAIALFREAIATWRPTKVSVSDFSYFSDGANKPEFGAQIRAETIEIYYLIINLIRREAAGVPRDKYGRPIIWDDAKIRSDALPVIANP